MQEKQLVEKPWAAVLGSPIAHSLSPLLHNTAYKNLGIDIDYRKIEVGETEIADLFANLSPQCRGLSVTMPLKQRIIPFLDQLDGMAKVTGVVNTVVFAGGGIKAGFNTDVHGIIAAVKEKCDQTSIESALVIGAGATACSAVAALAHLRIPKVNIAARDVSKPGNALQKAAKMGIHPKFIPLHLTPLVKTAIEKSDLVISTLPKLVADDLFQTLQPQAGQKLLDVVYDPWPSVLVQRFAAAEATIIPGWLMLLHQAVMQVSLFTSQIPEISPMRQALLDKLEAVSSI